MARQDLAFLAFNRGLVSALALARADIKRLALSAEEAGHFADTVALSEKVRADICFNNAARLLGLS